MSQTQPAEDLERSPSPPYSVDQDHDPASLLKATLNLRRVSPLYLGRGRDSGLEQPRLDALSRRLRDILVGDTVRGVQVGLEGTGTGALGRTGALLGVTMRWVATGTFLGPCPRRSADEGADASLDADETVESERESKRALWIDLEYENAKYMAVLVPKLSASLPAAADGQVAKPSWTHPVGAAGNSNPADPSHFIHLPLLLMRMPAPLQVIVAEFLASTFDCKVSPLRLGTRTMVRIWEDWTSAAPLPATKEVVIMLGFHVPSADGDKSKDNVDLGVKCIEVAIPAADVRRFSRAGEQSLASGFPSSNASTDDIRKLKRLAGPSDEEGWHWRGGEQSRGRKQAFMDALARYLDKHIALDLYHPGVRVVRVTCSAFLLSETRVKLAAGTADEVPLGVWRFVEALVDRAGGSDFDYSGEVAPW